MINPSLCIAQIAAMDDTFSVQPPTTLSRPLKCFTFATLMYSSPFGVTPLHIRENRCRTELPFCHRILCAHDTFLALGLLILFQQHRCVLGAFRLAIKAMPWANLYPISYLWLDCHVSSLYFMKPFHPPRLAFKFTNNMIKMLIIHYRTTRWRT